MPVNITANKVKVRSGGEYFNMDMVLDATIAERSAALEARGQEVEASIEAKGE